MFCILFKIKPSINRALLSTLFLGCLFLISCHDSSIHSTYPQEIKSEPKADPAENEAAFKKVLQTHLDAVSAKDLEALSGTMSPSGKMNLMLVDSELISTVDTFMSFHKTWFEGWPNATFTTKVLETNVGEKLGLAIVESFYTVPKPDSEDYTNRMLISYVLEKMDDQWYIINDQATSIEKTGISE